MRQRPRSPDQTLDERPQQRQIKHALGVRQCALGDARQAHAPADLLVFEDVFEGPKAVDRGVEEEHEMGHQNVVVEELAVAVARLGVQGRQLVFEHANQPAASYLRAFVRAGPDDVGAICFWGASPSRGRSSPYNAVQRKLRFC